MDKVSYASAYRTAAVLAALSHVDAWRDEPLRDGRSSIVGITPPAQPRCRAARRPLYERVCAALCRLPTAVLQRVGWTCEAPETGHRHRLAHKPADPSRSMEAVPDQPIVSHFALFQQGGTEAPRMGQ